MIYVFYVNRGSFLTFEDRITLERIDGLKQTIQKAAEIPTKSQVILVSGGYEPAGRTIVRDCHGGVEDNNPIYLYRKVDVDVQPDEVISMSLLDQRQFQERVLSLMNVQPSYNTMRQRVQLAKDFYDHARQQMEEVRRLVKEQHMMSQGWYVALANLDEKCERIRRRYAEFCETMTAYMADRGDYQRLVANFESVLETLQRIRLPESLVRACCDVSLLDASSITASQVAALHELEKEERRETGVSLLDWLNSFDKRGSLSQILHKARVTLERVNEAVAHKIAAELPDTLALANENSQEHRVVQGLEMRLTQMAHYQAKTEARVRNQHDLMTSLASNLDRLEKERDASVVGELCKQHKRVLGTMAENHKKQTEAVQLALNGKNDFMRNLHLRFQWLTHVEMMLMHQETYFGAVFTRLREMGIYKKVLSQAKVAAALYAQSLIELVRRREFADHYEHWAGNVVKRSTSIHKEEVSQRERAVHRLDNHFLWCLFRWMKMMPSKFALKRPLNVDANLPEISRSDLEDLKARVPELAPLLVMDEGGLRHILPEEEKMSPSGDGPQSDKRPEDVSGTTAVRSELQGLADVPGTSEIQGLADVPGRSELQGLADVPGRSEMDTREGELPGHTEIVSVSGSEVEVRPRGLDISTGSSERPSLASHPIPVPPRLDNSSSPVSGGGSPFVEMSRTGGEEEEEMFSSALLNLEAEGSRRSEAVQTDRDEEWRSMIREQLSGIRDSELPGLRQELSRMSDSVRSDIATCANDLSLTNAALGQLEDAYRKELEAQTMNIRAEMENERQDLLAQVAASSEFRSRLETELAAVKESHVRALTDLTSDLERRIAQEVDLAQRRLLLEHEVALETERGAQARVVSDLRDEARELRRQAEWNEERIGSLTKERDLLERASGAEKRMYETELGRLRDELEMFRSRRGRRISISSDSPQHILDETAVSYRRISVATVNTDSADEAELLEVEDLGSWPTKRLDVREKLKERIAELEAAEAQKDQHIADLERTVDRLSQQAIRDRESIRQLRTGSPSSRCILSSSPQMSRSPPVLEQPGPIVFPQMSASQTSTTPVTCPPKSGLLQPGVQASSMTESAISSVAGTPPIPIPGPPRDSRPVEPPAVLTTSAMSTASQRSLKIVLSQFRSGDRVLLLRNPSTGLWFMLSTDGESYFVHSDCFGTLDLDNDKFYTVVEFKSKEKCLARKDKNRFSLPAGQYFFRIKARPLRAAQGQAWPGKCPVAGMLTDKSAGVED